MSGRQTAVVNGRVLHITDEEAAAWLNRPWDDEAVEAQIVQQILDRVKAEEAILSESPGRLEP